MEAITTAYEHAEGETLKLSGVTGHQVRGRAAYWAYFKNTPQTDIRSAVGWRSTSVFALHYLQDVAADRAMDTRDLTMVAAGHTLRS